MLRRAREARGWSQATLALNSGVSQPVVSAYESGAREPTVASLRRLTRAMGLELVMVPPVRSAPDPRAAARQLEDVLSLAESMHLRPPLRPLAFPVLTRPR